MSTYDENLARFIESNGPGIKPGVDWEGIEQLSKSFAESLYGRRTVDRMEALSEPQEADPKPLKKSHQAAAQASPWPRQAPIKKNSGKALVVKASPQPKKPAQSDKDERAMRVVAFVQKLADLEEERDRLKRELHRQ